MNKRIVIDMKGDHVTLKALADAAASASGLLSELDHIVSKETTLHWEVSDLRFGSAIITTTPRLIKKNLPDRSDEVIRLFYNGISTLEQTKERPDGYTDKALEHARELAGVVAGDVKKLVFSILENNGKSEPLSVTQRVIASVNDLIESGRISYGSIEGRVEVLQGFGNYFSILDESSKRKIKCECSTAMLDEIAEKNLWKRFIIVTGEILEDRHGHPKSIKVLKYRPLQRENLPTPDDLLGLYKAAMNG